MAVVAEVWPDTPTPLEYNSSLCNGTSKPPHTAKYSYQPRRTHPTPDCGQPCADNVEQPEDQVPPANAVRARHVLALPPSYRAMKAKVIAAPPDRGGPSKGNRIWTEDPDGMRCPLYLDCATGCSPTAAPVEPPHHPAPTPLPAQAHLWPLPMLKRRYPPSLAATRSRTQDGLPCHFIDGAGPPWLLGPPGMPAGLSVEWSSVCL
jgi:hypothetical protein